MREAKGSLIGNFTFTVHLPFYCRSICRSIIAVLSLPFCHCPSVIAVLFAVLSLPFCHRRSIIAGNAVYETRKGLEGREAFARSLRGGNGGATQGACLAEPRKARFPARSAGNAPKLPEIFVNIKPLNPKEALIGLVQEPI
jgi:hypothetical protein